MNKILEKNILDYNEEKEIGELIIHFLKDGFSTEEIKLYLSLISKNKYISEKIFSRSKRYRIMKSLFNKGALIKIKKKNEENFKYLPLPPVFLSSYYTEERIRTKINEIGKEYLKKVNLKDAGFVSLNIKKEKPFLILILNNFIEEKALLKFPFEYKFPFQVLESKRISYENKTEKRIEGVIDNKIFFELLEIAPDTYGEKEFYGYSKFKK